MPAGLRLGLRVLGWGLLSVLAPAVSSAEVPAFWLDRSSYCADEAVHVISKEDISCSQVQVLRVSCPACSPGGPCPACSKVPVEHMCKALDLGTGVSVLEVSGHFTDSNYLLDVAGARQENWQYLSACDAGSLPKELKVVTDRRVYRAGDHVTYTITNVSDRPMYLLEGCGGSVVRYSLWTPGMTRAMAPVTCDQNIARVDCHEPGLYCRDPRIMEVLMPGRSLGISQPAPSVEAEKRVVPYVTYKRAATYHGFQAYLAQKKNRTMGESEFKVDTVGRTFVVLP